VKKAKKRKKVKNNGGKKELFECKNREVYETSGKKNSTGKLVKKEKGLPSRFDWKKLREISHE
jgi:hypothetical protein